MSKKEKITAEAKIRMARACIEGTIGICEAGRLMGVSHPTVEDWIRLYQAEGSSAFLPREGNRRYDPAVKEMAVKDYLSGRGSLQEICKIYKIRATRQLRSWIKVYNGHKDFKKQTEVNASALMNLPIWGS